MPDDDATTETLVLPVDSETGQVQLGGERKRRRRRRAKNEEGDNGEE